MLISNPIVGILTIRVSSGTITRAAATVSGEESITGLASKPVLVYFIALDDGATTIFSNGWDDATISSSTRSNTTANNASQTQSIHIETSIGDGHRANVSSMDSGGFTLNWTKIGNGRAITVKYIAVLQN